MKSLRLSSCVAVCAAAIQFAATGAEPLSAQVYYYGPPAVMTPPAYPLPGPNYVVYSPSYLAWRSSGYYGGNWGPYYYEPAALYPYISGTMIWPNVIPAYPPPTRWSYPR